MSGITISRPEVVNGHTDVICSTSIISVQPEPSGQNLTN